MEIKTPILVTGASGYVASWIVYKLLEKGHTVHGTVRDRSSQEKVGHLLEMDKTLPGTLKLFNADLLQPGSFNEAMQGCTLVMHTASPFIALNVKNPQKELVDPALLGTQNVLDSVNQTDTVTRVVLTSSVVAMFGDAADIKDYPGQIVNESSWNTSSSLSHQPYSYSKTVAEKAAWEMAAQQDRWDLITVHPAFVFGPNLSLRTDGTSNDYLLGFLDGRNKKGFPDLIQAMVDVRDVADVHIQAGFNQEAKGRYIASSESVTTKDMLAILKEHFPDKYPLPASLIPKWLLYLLGPFSGLSWKWINGNVGHPLVIDNSRTQKELGIQFRLFRKTLIDHVQQLEKDQLIA